jgi:rhodanese-related sulfurtransferase
MTTKISPENLIGLLDRDAELALIDVREEGVFGQSHLLFAANIPLSRLEPRFAEKITRRGTPIVLVDDNDGLADRAAKILAQLGYQQVQILDGGTQAWAAAGYELFSGLNVPSKAFGEYVEHAYGTESVSADELHQMLNSDQNMVVLDSRPMSEFNVMNIPTGIDCTGAELAYRVQEIAPDPETTIVVNCAGRTRSIIGAQSLRNIGIPNPVVALRNGTMGWHLAGYALEHGEDRRPPEVSSEGSALALQRARHAGARFGVRYINAGQLAQWREERTQRTLYILDVRDIAEFTAAHIADSTHAAGGQVVQATDIHIPVRNARVVLVDPALVRAIMTAGWLNQLGLRDVYVLESGFAAQTIISGPADNAAFAAPSVNMISTAAAATLIAEEAAVVIDFNTSLGYRDGHIAGAWFMVRARLQDDFAHIPKDCPLIVTSPDGITASWAAADIAAMGRQVSVIEGGTSAWQNAGLAMEMGMSQLASTPDDVFMRPYDGTAAEGVEAAMNAYLNWELELVAQIKRPGGTRFEFFPELTS